MSNQELHISWNDFHGSVKELATKLRGLERKFNKIIAITRGGLVPAAILGQELDIRDIDTVCLASYSDADHQQTSIDIIKDLTSEDDGILVIDDLVDTGTTFKYISGILPHAYRACIYAKPSGVGMVDTYVQDVPQDTWIFLPWEVS